MIHPPDGIRGVIRGRTIELERSTELPDGEVVTVQLRPVKRDVEALKRAFGGWAHDSDGLDEFLAQMRELRRSNRRWEEQ